MNFIEMGFESWEKRDSNQRILISSQVFVIANRDVPTRK